MLTVRQEEPGDAAAIRTINERAFDQPEEANIVDTLRTNSPGLLLSLVAVLDDQVVGHILFSPAKIEATDRLVLGMGLAPMAVLPEHQRQGIGSILVSTGIAALEECGCPFIIVLGHAEYYPRFGFVKASQHGIQCQWDVPDEAFMVLILDGVAMHDASGLARYRDEFNEAM